MDFLVSSVASFITSVTKLLPQWSFTHSVATDIATLTPYFQLANVLLPMQTLFNLFSLFVGLQLMLIALYWIDRVINLIRGAG